MVRCMYRDINFLYLFFGFSVFGYLCVWVFGMHLTLEHVTLYMQIADRLRL